MNVNSASRLCGMLHLQWLQDRGMRELLRPLWLSPLLFYIDYCCCELLVFFLSCPSQALLCMHTEWVSSDASSFSHGAILYLLPKGRFHCLVFIIIERWSHNYNPPTALEFENVLFPVGNFLLYKVNSVEEQLIF